MGNERLMGQGYVRTTIALPPLVGQSKYTRVFVPILPLKHMMNNVDEKQGVDGNHDINTWK